MATVELLELLITENIALSGEQGKVLNETTFFAWFVTFRICYAALHVISVNASLYFRDQ